VTSRPVRQRPSPHLPPRSRTLAPLRHCSPRSALSKLEHEPCLRRVYWHARCIFLFACCESTSILHRRPLRAEKLTEDPPFGGLWCDQPAIFLLEKIAVLAIFSRPYTEDRGQKAWFLPAAAARGCRPRSVAHGFRRGGVCARLPHVANSPAQLHGAPTRRLTTRGGLGAG